MLVARCGMEKTSAEIGEMLGGEITSRSHSTSLDRGPVSSVLASEPSAGEIIPARFLSPPQASEKNAAQLIHATEIMEIWEKSR